MRIGVLQCGLLVPELAERFGQYPEIFDALIRSVDPTVTTAAWAAVDGDIPKDPHACDAWLLTGSRHGVYDDLPFIEPLKAFLRQARAAGVPLIGICFGHQLMAEAFGGRAVKSDKGWGIGMHDYDVVRRPAWMGAAGDRIAMQAVHQDQVTAIPDDATCLATSPFCEFAMLSYGDPERPDAISIQPHPEISAELARGIIDLRAGVQIPLDLADQARKTVDRPADSLAFVRWALAYVRRAMAEKAAA